MAMGARHTAAVRVCARNAHPLLFLHPLSAPLFELFGPVALTFDALNVTSRFAMLTFAPATSCHLRLMGFSHETPNLRASG